MCNTHLSDFQAALAEAQAEAMVKSNARKRKAAQLAADSASKKVCLHTHMCMHVCTAVRRDLLSAGCSALKVEKSIAIPK